MRRVGQDYLRNIARSDAPAGSNYSRHSASECRANFLGREQVLFQAGPEAINQRAGSSKSGQFHGGGRSEQDPRPQGKLSRSRPAVVMFSPSCPGPIS